MSNYILLIIYLSVFGVLIYAIVHYLIKSKRLNLLAANENAEQSKQRLMSITALKNIDAYIMLTDEKFTVAHTNYYIKTNIPTPLSPAKVGEVIKCKNGLDAGGCGQHKNCSLCVIRKNITESFKKNTEFKDLETRMTVYLSENRTETTDLFVSVSGTPLQFEEKRYVLLTIKDITSLKKKQTELEEAKKEAEYATKLKGAFIANLNHEIRTPLSIISGFANLLGGTNDIKERREYMQLIDENTEKLTKLIDDILELSALESDSIDSSYSEIDLNHIFQKVEETYNTTIDQNKGVTLSVHLPRPTCYIHAVDRWLTQIFEKTVPLMINYTKENNQMTIGYQVRENDIYCYLFSTDSTIVPIGSEECVFEWFHKAFSDNKNTGTLLAIAKKIVQLMGGDMALFTEKGKGTTLWFTLPIQPIKNSVGENDLFV